MNWRSKGFSVLNSIWKAAPGQGGFNYYDSHQVIQLSNIGTLEPGLVALEQIP